MTEAQIRPANAYLGFSGPHQDFDDEFFEMLVGQYATSVLGLVLDRFGDSLPARSPGIRELLSEVASNPSAGFDIFWSPGVASMLDALRRDDAGRAASAIARFLIQAAARGLAADWDIRLAAPEVFHWDSYVLPPAVRLRIRHRGDLASIGIDSGDEAEEVRLTRNPATGEWSANGNLKQLAVARDGQLSVVLISREGAPRLDCRGDIVARTTPEHARAVADALRLLRRGVPRYYGWVARTLRNLVILQTPDQVLKSGNFGRNLGMFSISHCQDPILVGEMLVHECSHQYYQVVINLEDVVDRSHTRTYYSPFKRKARTLDRILLAYHAFANVYLYYRECIDSGLCSPQGRFGLASLVEEVEEVEKILRSENDKLTSVGRALADPLYRERHSCPMISVA